MTSQSTGLRIPDGASHTTQDAFHPMRGHVHDGTIIEMRDGTCWRIKADTCGWRLLRSDGSEVIATNDAYVLTGAIVQG